MIANCDIVLASPSAVFALPEVKRGVVAIAGALPRLARAIGRMRAMEMALRYELFGADFSLLVMNLRSKRNFLLPKPLLQLSHLPEISNADSEAKVGGTLAPRKRSCGDSVMLSVRRMETD